MSIDLRQQFLLRDISNYTTYQMVEYALNVGKKKCVQQYVLDMFMYKISPTQQGLHNYVYVFSKTLSDEQIKAIQSFF